MEDKYLVLLTHVPDYAAKHWSGLVSDYYGQRWTMFCELLINVCVYACVHV